MFFAQRVSLPGGRGQYAPQSWVTVETDSEHIPHLAFVPIGCGPERGDRGRHGVAARQRNLDPQVVVAVVREQVVDQGKVGFGLLLAVGALALVDGGQVVETQKRALEL